VDRCFGLRTNTNTWYPLQEQTNLEDFQIYQFRQPGMTCPLKSSFRLRPRLFVIILKNISYLPSHLYLNALGFIAQCVRPSRNLLLPVLWLSLRLCLDSCICVYQLHFILSFLALTGVRGQGPLPPPPVWLPPDLNLSTVKQFILSYWARSFHLL
jgi:hypothetical protein